MKNIQSKFLIPIWEEKTNKTANEWTWNDSAASFSFGVLTSLIFEFIL